MTGRPSSYTQEAGDEICRRLIEGESLRAICANADMPSIMAVWRWRADPEREAFRAQYAAAREAQGDNKFDDVGDVAQKVLTGELEPAAGRVAIDAIKWQASKLAPKSYGDKLATEHTGTVEVEVKDVPVREIAKALLSVLNGA